MRSPPWFEDPPLLRTHALPVSGGHVLHVQEFGRPDGLPVLVLHGGPGSGSSPLHRRFFDPARWRVIQADQRGCGLSTPAGGLAHNTTEHLLDDIDTLREHLRLPPCLVMGGSWGAALALAYAGRRPQAVSALLLRASFTARREDVRWFFHGAAAQRPRAWQRLVECFAPADRADLLQACTQALLHGPPEVQARVASAWQAWEAALTQPGAEAPDPPAPPLQGDALTAAVRRLRLQAHYLSHDCWLAQPELVARCAAVPAVPTRLVHSRDDLVCRPEGAQALADAMPHARLQWVDGAGHDPRHPAMAAPLLQAIAHCADHGDFPDWP